MTKFIYLVCISSAACWLINFVPTLTIISGVGWGITLLLGGYLVGRRQLSIIFGLNILLLYGLSGSSNFFVLLVFGIPSFIMGLHLNLQKGYYELQKWGMITAALIAGIFMVMIIYGAANSYVTGMQEDINQYIQQSINVQSDEVKQYYAEQGVSPEEMQANLEQSARWAFMHLPALYFWQSILVVQLIVSLSAYICRRQRIPILEHRPFREEIMPWPVVWVIITALSLWLWGRDEMNNLYYAGANLLMAAAPITFYYGLATIVYRWHSMSRKSRTIALPFIIIGGIILFIPVIIFISLLGLFDSLLDYRNLYRKKEEMR